MRFAAAIHATTDFGDDRIPFPDALAMVAECGFSDVMLLARRGAGGILRRGETPPGALINLLESDLGLVSGLLQRNGITPRIVFASGVNPAEPESGEWLRRMADVARKLQCSFVGHNCGSAPAPGMSTDEKAEQIRALAALIDTVAAEMEDIQFAVDVHYHGLVEMIPDCDFYLEHLKSPNAGLLLNMGHMTTNRQPGWELALNYPDRTPIIAWKDHFAGTDRERPAQSFQLGTAETPFEKYVEVIKPQVSDRAHVISVEGIDEDKRRDVLAASYRYMKDLWDRFYIPEAIMYKINIDELEPTDVNTDGAKAARMQWLLAQENGAPNFAMRRFIVAPGGCTPYHSHPWEHEAYCLLGHGVAKTEQGETAIRAGDAILVLPDELHNFINTGDGPLEFLCLVPNGPATEGH